MAASRQIQHALTVKDKERLKRLSSAPEAKSYLEALVGKSIPEAVKRDVLSRFATVIKMAKNGQGGYPSANEVPKRFTLTLNFNGAGFGSYIKIGGPYNPPNHNGPRGGKYRGQREIRKVTLRVDTKSPVLDFDVLFHRALPPDVVSYPKSVKLTRSEDNRWFVGFSIESRLPEAQATKKFAGLDYNWRGAKDAKDGLGVLDIGSESTPRESFVISFSENRRARRQRLGKSRDAIGLPPYVPTPEGRKSYQKAMDERKDELKRNLALHEKAGWRKIREVAASNELAPEQQRMVDEALAWYGRALAQFSFMCATETANRDRNYRAMAIRILAYCTQHGITDVGSPDDDYKGMAEEERDEGLLTYESRMMNVRDANRQIVAPGRLRQIVEWTLKKNGIRVHRMNPWRTSQRCLCGADTKSRDLSFSCSGCGKKLHRSDVAVWNAARLASECGDGDDHPRVCSRNGKSRPYHGFPGCDEAVAKKKSEKALKKKERSKKQPQGIVANQVT